jgi:fatty acid desaturase
VLVSPGEVSDDNRRAHTRFDLADILLIVGVATVLVAIYLIGGGAWLLLAVGVAMIAAALRLSDDF